jgi:hypothetical protein
LTKGKRETEGNKGIVGNHEGNSNKKENEVKEGGKERK